MTDRVEMNVGTGISAPRRAGYRGLDDFEPAADDRRRIAAPGRRLHRPGGASSTPAAAARSRATAAGVDEFLGRLGNDGVAVVIEPVDQRPDRGIFLILDD